MAHFMSGLSCSFVPLCFLWSFFLSGLWDSPSTSRSTSASKVCKTLTTIISVNWFPFSSWKGVYCAWDSMLLLPSHTKQPYRLNRTEDWGFELSLVLRMSRVHHSLACRSQKYSISSKNLVKDERWAKAPTRPELHMNSRSSEIWDGGLFGDALPNTFGDACGRSSPLPMMAIM